MHSARHVPRPTPGRGRRRKRWWLVVVALAVPPSFAWADPVVLRIDPDSSRVEYHITNPLGDVTNLAGRPAGEVNADSAHAIALAGHIIVDLRQLATGIGMRDHHVKSSSILDVETYPLAEFALVGVEPDSTVSRGVQADGHGGTPAIAHGTLSLHGVTHEVGVPVRLLWQRDRLRVRGSFTILLADYRIPRPRRLVIVAGKSVDVRLDLLFVP
jgi:polyisoprenoid-binding protein YceI